MVLTLLLACVQAQVPRPGGDALPGPRTVRGWSLRPAPALSGLCDASAAARGADNTFLVGDDEESALYRFPAVGGSPTRLRLPMEGGELDVEGSATVPGGVWWVTSHDRGKGTTAAPSRRHLFRTSPDGVVQEDVTVLWTRLLAHPELGPLLRATEGQTSKAVGGFSIEALHADGAHLWLGLRAPVVDGEALLVRLRNPSDPEVDQLQRYDLGGRGWRALEPHRGVLYGVAGPPDDEGDFQLVRIDLDAGTAEPVGLDFGTLRPEGLVSLPEGLLAISDDGKVEVDGTRCRKLPAAQRRARAAFLIPDRPP